MLGNSVFAYLDELIITSNDPEKLKKFTSDSSEVTGGWSQSKTKREFLKAKIKFLGHEVDGERINTLNYKIAAVKKFPKP